MSVTIIVMLILAILLVIFTLQNSFEITINVFMWEIQNAPMVLVLLVCILLGYLLAATYYAPRVWNLQKKFRRSASLERKLENELIELRRTRETGPEGIELEINDEEEDNKGFFGE
jgi:lipopolysaccharide assembly protein A